MNDFLYQSDEDLLTDLLEYEFPKEELSPEEEALLASFWFLKIWEVEKYLSSPIIKKVKQFQPMFNYSLTSDQDQVLLDMFQYFDDIGLPEHIDSKAYESLQQKFFAQC